jgi:Protein of unknown function (DUF551)
MNGETSRERMTDPSSSTPASPESRCSDCWATNCEDRPKPCRCTCHRKCQAEDTTPASPATEPTTWQIEEWNGRRWAVVYRDNQRTIVISDRCQSDSQAKLLLANCATAADAYAASVRAASTGTGWIPVSEKLPPKNEPVIVFDSMYDEVAEGQLSAYGWEKSIGKDDCEITAWQPFPDPPVASQKGKEKE